MGELLLSQLRDRISLFQLRQLSNDRLLQTRFCELDLRVEDTPVWSYVERLYKELEQVGLPHFRPKIYFGDDWFCPEGSALISVPFYLAHPRLIALHQRQTGKAEGRHPRDLMRLLRHEAGHCFSHIHQLNRKRSWQKLFGSPKRPYNVDEYAVDPTSRDYVRHLSGHYAQSHPDEDFAETFAVWLSPTSRWRETYADYPKALAKLLFVDAQVKVLASRSETQGFDRPLSHVRQLRSTLGRYYRKRNKASAKQS